MWRRKRNQQDFTAEIQAHIRLETDRLIDEGVSPEEARAAAFRRFGNVVAAEEKFYESRHNVWLDHLARDLRHAARTLLRNPGATMVAVLMLASAIGATSAVFSVANAVLLRPLPYEDPSRLAAVSGVYQPGKTNRIVPVIALPDMKALRKENHTLDSISAFMYLKLPIRIEQRSFHSVCAVVDRELLRTLGNQLSIGAPFDLSQPDRVDDTVIITQRLWTDAFQGDPEILGRTLLVDGKAFAVRGVLRPGFQFPRPDASFFTQGVDLLLPESNYPSLSKNGRQWFSIARLKVGVSLERAQSELQNIAAGHATQNPQNRDWSFRLTSLAEETARSSRQAILITLGISGVLLLMGSTNLMSLLFSLGAARLRELAIRRAIGSTTGALIRQTLTESLCLTGLGGAGGLLLAWLGIDVLVQLSPIHLPVNSKIGMDGAVFAFTLFVCFAASLLAGLFPAIYFGLTSNEAMRHARVRTTAGRAVLRVQQMLWIAQTAMGVGLLAAAGLLTHSLWRLSNVDPGFRGDNIIGLSVAIPADHSDLQIKRFYQDALDEVRAIPGVTSAGWISFLPPETRAGAFMPVALEGVAASPDNGSLRANHMIASAGYFPTMRISLAGGRDFNSRDTAQSAPVIMINEAFARTYFANQYALRRTIGIAFEGNKPVREVIGIVKDTRDRGLAANPIPTVYLPFTQIALPYGSLALRTEAAPETVIPEIRRRLTKLDPGIPLTDFQRVRDRIFDSIEEPRFYAVVAAACAVIAVLSFAIGLYGIVSFSISRRTSEFGIRVALGASRTTIVRMVLSQGFVVTAIGAALGVGLSLLLTRILKSMLFEVKPIDPLSLVLAAGIPFLVTLLASYAPARRASRVHPIVALRHEQ